jgi:hypothetical protein
LHEHLLLAPSAAALLFDGIRAGVTRRLAQPAGQNGGLRQPLRLAREDDEHRLGDFFRQMSVTHLPARH